jgi:UDPglucose--hexose-1-phosphate uridylyltransferase
MPQLRQNIILKDWVVISTERAKRPEQLKEDKNISSVNTPEYDEKCPFCPGNEAKTGNDHEFHRIGDHEKWSLRVIPNKFPALIPPEESEIKRNTQDFFRWMDGVGHHEVLIESEKHNLTLATMDLERVKDVIRAYQLRIDHLMQQPYVESVIAFRNHGLKAGASLLHPHSQIIALPVIPRDIMSRMNEAIRYHEEHRECMFCDVLKMEMEGGKRIILESKHFVAFTPYAASTPFHLWIYPKRHSSSIISITDEEMSDFAETLRTVLRKLYFGLNDPDYNFIIRNSPKGYGNTVFFHWYLTIVPRLTRTAGFELGSGMFINPSIPEENAEYLRSVKE